MNDYSSLAFKSERAASRKLAQRLGISEQEALHQTLTLAAGIDGIENLLAQRRALRDADAARASARRARSEALHAVQRARHVAPEGGWRAWFDGSAKPNPGQCSIGGLVTGPAGERIEISEAAGHGDSSVAEYRALIAILQAAIAAGASALTVHGDSKVVIDDVSGATREPVRSLAPLREQARALMARCGEVQLRWVPRHRNPEADALSQRAPAAHACGSPGTPA